MLWRKSLVRRLTDFDQAVDCGEVTAQIPQLYFEKFTEHRLESLVEPICTETVWDRGIDRSASKDVLSSICSVGKYSSHGNQTSRREKGLLRVRPLSWHFLLWRVRVSCHLWTGGNPDGLRSGRFHNNERFESWKQPAKPESIISVLREAGGQCSSSRQKPFVTPLYLLLVVVPEPAMLWTNCIQYFFAGRFSKVWETNCTKKCASNIFAKNTYRKNCTMDASQLEQNRADGSNVYTCRRHTIMPQKKTLGEGKVLSPLSSSNVFSHLVSSLYDYKWWQSLRYTNQIQCIFMSHN